jgi:hypothetical protein
MSHDIETIALDAVRINGGTQSRAEINDATIAEYAEVIRAGTDLPPVVTFFDGVNFWLADGFHRYHAHRAAGAMEISSEVRPGTCREAVLYSVGANASHGLRRTNEDKRRAVQTLLGDPEWSAWSSEAIAKACAVSPRTVSAMRISANAEIEPVRTVERNGKTYEQNTTNIGKAKPADDAPKVTDPLPDLTTSPDAPAPVPFDEVQALREQLAEEIERNTELAASMKETLADNQMMGRVFDADDRIKASMDEAKHQKAIAESAERTLASKSGEFIARAKAVTLWKGRAERAEKKLKKLEAAK